MAHHERNEGFFSKLRNMFRSPHNPERGAFSGPGGPQGGPGASGPGQPGYDGAVNIGDEGATTERTTDQD